MAGASLASVRGAGPAIGVAVPMRMGTAAWPSQRAAERRSVRLIASLRHALERRDRYTASHCSRVAAFADLIAGELGLAEARLCDLRIASALHDLGKLDVPLEILHKPMPLDAREQEIMRAHVLAGVRRAAALSESVCRIIAQHHERPDGQGYPLRLQGDEILLEARIVAVADAFDAMTSDRPYRRALDPAGALQELIVCAQAGPRGLQFDPLVVAAFERRFDDACALCRRGVTVPSPAA